MKCFPYYSGNIVNIVKEVKCAYEPSGRSLSRFPQHEATRNIFTSHYGVVVHRRVTPVLNSCLAQEHNAMSPARSRTRTARPGVEHTNHEAIAPFIVDISKRFFW